MNFLACALCFTIMHSRATILSAVLATKLNALAHNVKVKTLKQNRGVKLTSNLHKLKNFLYSGFNYYLNYNYLNW